MSKVRVLPLLVLVAFFTFSLRFSEFLTDVRGLDASSFAAQPKLPAPESVKPETAEAEKLQLAASSAPAPANEEQAAPAATSTSNVPLGDNWSDPASVDLNFDGDTDEIIAELIARRRDLDMRERQLEQREALLLATESQVEQKLDELQILREELRSLLDQQEQEEEARIKSLVKIYEGMKPKEAANVFNTLDMEIMLSIVSRMSERKSAPILAAMEPSKARALTVLLAQQVQLPDTSSLNE
jgi:flagellar motility protein MotE (MotC chaperone)